MSPVIWPRAGPASACLPHSYGEHHLSILMVSRTVHSPEITVVPLSLGHTHGRASLNGPWASTTNATSGHTGSLSRIPNHGH